MPPPICFVMVLSLEKRWDIVRWTQEGKRRREVAGLAEGTVRTVQNVLRCYREYSDSPLPKRSLDPRSPVSRSRF